MEIKILDNELPFATHKTYSIFVDNNEIQTLVTHDPGKVKAWVINTEKLHKCRLHRLIVGLDIEWRPNLTKNSYHPVATLQLCVGKSCLIFQILRAPNIPRRLREFLGNSLYTFVGVGIENDVRRLMHDYGLGVANMRDLRSWAAQELGKQNLLGFGLKVLVQEVLGEDMKKPENITLSTWDNYFLTTDQVAYASLDAYFSFETGRRLSAWYD